MGVGLHNLKDEVIVLFYEARVDKLGLEIGVAFLDQRRLNLRNCSGRELEYGELVDFGACRIADADDLGEPIQRRDDGAELEKRADLVDGKSAFLNFFMERSG